MSKHVVLELPARVEAALDEAVREDGISTDELVVAALNDYLFVRKFRRLRERMLAAQAPETLTDEEVFERVS